MCVDFHLGFECEEHNNPADFFLDVIMQCEDVNGAGKLIATRVCNREFIVGCTD